MGMTLGAIDATINLVGSALCRGMLVGGPQVGTAAGGSEQGTGRTEVDRRGPSVGGAGVSTSRQEGGGWRSAGDEEGPSRPQPD